MKKQNNTTVQADENLQLIINCIDQDFSYAFDSCQNGVFQEEEKLHLIGRLSGLFDILQKHLIIKGLIK